MGSKIYQIFEYAYLAIAILSIYEVATKWSTDRDRAYLFAFFGVVAIFMFIFKRKFRKKIEKRRKQQ